MSSDEDTSFNFKPLGRSLHVRRAAREAEAAAAASPRQAFQSSEDIAAKYLRKTGTPSAAATSPAAPTSPMAAWVRPSSSGSSRSITSPRSAAPSQAGHRSPTPHSTPALGSWELDASVGSAGDPGSKASPRHMQQPGSHRQPGNSPGDSFFTESPFQPRQQHAQQHGQQQPLSPRPAAPSMRAPSPNHLSVPTSPTAAVSSPRSPGAHRSPPAPTRHSYVDPKSPGRMQRQRIEEEEAASEQEESAFAAQIRPLGSSLWNKAIEPKQASSEAQQRQESSRGQAASMPNRPQQSRASEEERKSSEQVRLEQFSPAPAFSQTSPVQRHQSPSSRHRSPPPPAVQAATAAAAAALASPNSSPMEQSRIYAELLERWERDQEEIKHLRAEKALHEARQRELQQQQEQPQQKQDPTAQHQSEVQAAPSVNPLQFFTGVASHRTPAPALPPALESTPFGLDASGQLQVVHNAHAQQSLAITASTLLQQQQSSFYAGDVQLDEVLADHKRLRLRLRAAQHAIEALASHSEPGQVDISLGQALRGGSVTKPVGLARNNSARAAYASAVQNPNALSLSQYAHLPPARAVLKLLHRLEREEESYLADRSLWKKERSSLLQQLQTLYTDLKHLTALSQQAQQSEMYHRAREAEQEAALAKMKADREEERKRWNEVEQALRAQNLRERVRFNQDLSKLERNDGHYKEKYEAVLQVLRRYEHDGAPGAKGAAGGAASSAQQEHLMQVLSAEFETERAEMLSTLAKQESKFRELQQQVSAADRHKDALLMQARAELEEETARRVRSEQQLMAMQHSMTRNMEEKLKQLNSYVHSGPQGGPTVQQAAAEMANEYARAQHAEPLYESTGRRYFRSRSRERERGRVQEPEQVREQGRSRSGSLSSRRGSSRVRVRYMDSNDESRSVSRSPERRTHPHAPAAPLASSFPHRRRRRSFRPRRVASAQHILSLLPPNSNVRGAIELLMSPAGSDEDELVYEDEEETEESYDEQEEEEEQEEDEAHERRQRTGRPRYSRPTYSSKHAAALQHQLYWIPPSKSHPLSRPSSRSRSRSAGPPVRECERDRDRDRVSALDDGGARVRREVDRRVQFEEPRRRAAFAEEVEVAPSRRSRSQTRTGSDSARERQRTGSVTRRVVGPAANGHVGSARVGKKQPAASSQPPPFATGLGRQGASQPVSRGASRRIFEHDRYGRVSEARYV